MITRQAQVIAYADDYVLMMWLTLLALPMLLLMRRPRQAAGGTPAAAIAD
jgi:DHA2 family multidrug resistance protein